MNKRVLVEELLKLEPSERFEIMEEVLEGVEDANWPLTAEQRAELDRRLEECERDPNAGAPWQEVMERLRARFK